VVPPSCGIYRSADQGQTWSRVGTPPDSSYLKTICSGPDGVLFASSWSGLYRSTDDGIGWTLVWPAPEVWTIAVHTKGYVFAARNQFWSDLYRSTDNGNTWGELRHYCLLARPSPRHVNCLYADASPFCWHFKWRRFSKHE
jgi:photosystem II stability/assembly factor-like uncharacterized protein